MKNIRKNKVELLAPVGSWDSLKAAVQNGANAVYLGGKEFSARASANNFDREEMKEAVAYCHQREVSVFVTVNTLIKQRELEDFKEYVKYLYDIDIDSLIIQDIGVASLVKRLLPDFEIHASTQMVAHSLEDVLYLETVGFDRVVLARELPLDEIEHISKNSKADIEVFVHGALCVCYSGACLMSSMLGKRSGNRGRCAQPCRQKYRLIDIETGKEVESKGDYLLSTKDLMSIEDVGRIVESGVYSLKIEGRMKKPEYVATVVDAYRKAVDEYIESGDLNLKEGIIEDLYTIFNRKFTNGYILGDVGSDIMNSQKPNNQGLYIGKVLDCNRKTRRLKIALESTLKKGDGINLGGGTIGRIIKGKNISEIGHAGETVELDFIGEVKRNQEIYKTSDGELLERVQSTYRGEKEFVKIPISASVQIKLNEYPALKIRDDRGNEVEVSGDKLVEEALKVAITEEKVVDQLEKLGNTPYFMKDIDLSLDEGVSVPVSVLNKMRREAVDSLNIDRVKIKERKFKDCNISELERIDREHKDCNISALECIDRELKSSNISDIECEDIDIEGIGGSKSDETIKSKSEEQELKREELEIDLDYADSKIRVKVKNLEQLEAVLGKNLDCIYYDSIDTLDSAISMAVDTGDKIVYSAPRIVRDRVLEVDSVKNIPKDIPVLIGNLGMLDRFKDREIHVDYSLNTFNRESLKFFKKSGVKSVCMSLEMSMDEISEVISSENENIDEVIKKDNRNIDTEALVYGYIPMMVSEYCPMGVVLRECRKNKRCELCSQGRYALEDSEGSRFRITQDKNCRSSIYHNKPLCVLDELKRLSEAGISVFRLDFTFEDGDTVGRIVDETIKIVENENKIEISVNELCNKVIKSDIMLGKYYEGVE
ncbi:MAG: U32 family peptidase [Clostridioides sp.]|jgi:putative protease|nr:U32 family peptidase [Clostridioides sp.]